MDFPGEVHQRSMSSDTVYLPLMGGLCNWECCQQTATPYLSRQSTRKVSKVFAHKIFQTQAFGGIHLLIVAPDETPSITPCIGPDEDHTKRCSVHKDLQMTAVAVKGEQGGRMATNI